MIDTLKKVFLRLFTLIFTIYSMLILLQTESLSAAEGIDNKLINKVSQSYTKKFCNAIGFGLSKESAMDFSLAENKQVFKKRKELIVNMTNNIPGLSCKIPEGAFYTMPNIKKTGLSSKQMETLLLEELYVASVAGTSFGKFGEGYIRFSYANSIDNIKTALNRIHDYAIKNKWNN